MSEKGIVEGERASRLDTYFKRTAPFGFSGAFLLARDRDILINKGYGLAIRKPSVPNTADTVFCIGSITKQFTAAAILTLEMSGRLKTEQSIDAFFDGVPDDKKPVTLHHLLTHTAGIISSTGDDYAVAPRDDVVQKALDAPLHFPPGTSFEYSNTGYSLLGAVVEIAAGQSYEEYLHQHLFKPSGMFFTGYRIPNWSERTVATWYAEESGFTLRLNEHDQPHWNIIGNGEMLSTTEDMHRWYLALKGEEILSANAKKKLFTPFLNNYAYGWNVTDTDHGKVIQHDGGSDLGSSALFTWYVDHDILTVLFCNQSYGEHALISPLRGKVEKLVFGEEAGFLPVISTSRRPNMKGFEGTYQLPDGGQLLLQSDGGHVTLTAVGQDAINAIFSLSLDLTRRFGELMSRTARMVNAVLTEDYEYGKLELNDENRIRGWRRLLLDRLRLSRNKEARVDTAILGALPWPRSEDTVEIVVNTKHDQHEVKFALLWRNGVLWGLTTAPDAFTMRMLPASRRTYVGYDLSTGKNVEVSFDVDRHRRVTGLIVHGKGSSLKALKV